MGAVPRAVGRPGPVTVMVITAAAAVTLPGRRRVVNDNFHYIGRGHKTSL